MKKNKWRPLASLGIIIYLFLLMTPLVYAATNQYQVDMLIFRYNNAVFQGLDGNLMSDQSVTLGPEMSEATHQQYIWLSHYKSKLRYRMQTLSRIPHVEVIGLYSWTQPIYVRNTPVRIDLGNDLSALLKLSRATFINVELSYADNKHHFSLARRIKAKELNYFDSPSLGMLLQVTPIK